MRIDAIIIGERHRHDLGDIDGLARWIDDVGLLHPVVVRPDGLLIAGERRLVACRQLGWTEVPVPVVDLDDVVRGEFAENACRKDFSPSELVAIGEAVERLERERARIRQAHGGPRSGKLPERETGDARDKTAALFGVSGRTYEKAKAVVAAAREEPGSFGQLPAPLRMGPRVLLFPVAEIAAALGIVRTDGRSYVAVDPDGRSVGNYKSLREAVRALPERRA
jgi:ParB-like chromosome segregation protein Spo0J